MALSLRNALNCIGAPANASVLRDLFGYFLVPKTLSLKTQIELLKHKSVDLNVILVSEEDFAGTDINSVHCALQITREIYAQVNFAVGIIKWYAISRADAGSKAVIDSGSEAKELTNEWTAAGHAVDVFVVRVYNGADGRSAVDGSCDKDDGKGMTGAVASLNGSDANIGNTFAHEIGHYLGLDHIKDSNNFIGGDGASDSWTGIYSWQGSEMKKHCFVWAACP